MQGIRASPFAQTDGGHFHQTGFIDTPESCVGFDPSHDDNSIGFIGEFVHPDFIAAFQMSDLYRFHAGIDGTIAGFPGDTVTLQQLTLAFIGGTAMAAHGWNDPGLTALLPYPLGQSPQNQGHIGNLPAAAGENHPHTGPDTVFHTLQLLPQYSGDIPDAVVGENLAYPEHFWDFHILQQLPQTGLFLYFHYDHLTGKVGGPASVSDPAPEGDPSTGCSL